MRTVGRVLSVLRDPRGITLAEVVVASGIILVGLVALIAAMPLGTSLIGESSRKTTATFLAQQRMERIKNAQWCTACGPPASPTVDVLGGGTSPGTAPVAEWPDEAYDTIVVPESVPPQPCPSPLPPSVSCYPRFRRQVRIADCSVVSCSGIAVGALVNTLRQVSVTVFFFPLAGTGRGGATEETVQLVTLITRKP
jgi:hypothetical protein